MGEFVGRPIEVRQAGDIKTPAAFRLGDTEYEVAEVLEAWQDQGFGLAEPLKKNWRLRHHRNYYRVRTDEGEVYELYLDWQADRRLGKRRQEKSRWFVHRRIS